MIEFNYMENESYLKKIINFYLSPSWTSLFTTIFLLIYGYLVVSHFYYIIIALKFVWYTITISKQLVGLNEVFWGLIFTLSLVVPFSVSLYALAVPYEISLKKWKFDKKAIAITLLSLLVILSVVVMDRVLTYTATKPGVIDFVIQNSLTQRLPF